MIDSVNVKINGKFHYADSHAVRYAVTWMVNIMVSRKTIDEVGNTIDDELARAITTVIVNEVPG